MTLIHDPDLGRAPGPHAGSDGAPAPAPTVAIVGMGYVGLPTALGFVASGARVIGIDVNEDRLAATSPTFRARSRRADLDSPEVVLRFRIDEFGDHSGRQHDWDGVHVGLRYGSPDDLYYISVARRDGTVALKRKSGGAYETLAVADHELSLDEWHEATVAVEDTTVGTWLRLRLDGENVLEVLDTTDPLPPGGRVSLRSDNVAVTFADVQVRDRS
jgi:hypothetical protein